MRTSPFRSADASSTKVELTAIVPVYNSSPYLPELFSAFERQTCYAFRVVFVDDGSTDESPVLLDEWAKRASGLGIACTVIHKENGGQSSARNLGLRRSIGTKEGFTPWTLFVDSDDLIAPNAVERLLATAEPLKTDILLYGASSIYESDELERSYPSFQTAYDRSFYKSREVISGPAMLAALLDENKFVVQPCLQLLSSSFLLDAQITFAEGIIHEDNLFSTQCLLRAKRVAMLDENLYVRRVRMGSTMTKPPSWENVNGYFTCLRILLEEVPRGNESAQLASILVNRWIDLATDYYAALPEDECNRIESLSEKDRVLFSATVIARHRHRLELHDALRAREEARRERDIAEKELQDVRGSKSFRIGLAVTAAPRWVRKKIGR